MPTFQAINIEPEENVDDQIDTTKELHVDEALKRFQAALKWHAQGPDHRDEARAAYHDLFDCDIFKYREAKTEYERAQMQTDGKPELLSLESFSTGLDIDAGGADGVAASLSQALYLSYKNYGQFFLDELHDQSIARGLNWKAKPSQRVHHREGSKVLQNWTAALDQDPSDPELWRKAARFAAAINSRRIQRYCLEAAIELDDDPTVSEVMPPSLAEGMAGEQLRQQLQLLEDRVALCHPIMSPWQSRELPDLIRRHLDPIPFLPNPTETLTPPPRLPDERLNNGRPPVNADSEEDPGPVNTWSAIGVQLMKCLEDIHGAFAVCDAILRGSREDVDMKNTTNQPPKVTDTPELDVKGEAAAEPKADPKADTSKSSKRASTTLPNRKRSQSTAGLPDEGEENTAEKRSKRIRRRETERLEEAAEQTTSTAKQLQPFQEADQHLLELTKTHLEALDVDDADTFHFLATMIESCGLEDKASKLSRLASQDLRVVLSHFSEDTAWALLNKKEQPTLGLSSFLDHAKTGSEEQSVIPSFDEKAHVRAFANRMNENRAWMTTRDVVFEWTKEMSTSYVNSAWTEKAKITVVHMLNNADALLYDRVTEDMELSQRNPDLLGELKNVIPMILELTVDVYERITNPSSVVDYATRTKTKHRLARWLDLASTYIHLADLSENDSTCARFLWAATMTSSLSEAPVREHILGMWTSLRDFLTTENIEPIRLPNNVVMPVVSPAAADREISKLTTMDFFLSLFQDEMENPVHVIETLEPVLNPASVVTDEDKPVKDCASQSLVDLWKFLENSSTELRFFLWSRLGDAYDAIGYPTKRFSCQLKSIEMIVNDVESETYAKNADDSRRLLLMRTLKSLDELLIRALTTALNDMTAFDVIDMVHIRATAPALAKINCILHVAAQFEDEMRVGMASAPSSSTFQSLLGKLREMQVRTWSLQYTIIRCGLRQMEVIEPEKDLANYLAAIHRVIGLRKFCKASNKIFLKMMRMDLLKFKDVENWEDYLGQVLFDLHGLKLGVGIWELEDHGCPPENLEKKQAMQLVEKVMILAHRLPMKDLIKSDLKTTIDHMQQSIGQTKSTPQMIHNLRNYTEFLKKPIHPLRLYQALKGNVFADAVTVNAPESNLAKHGWFFLLGMMALTKFKGVDLNRRQTPGATDDLRIGATFLRFQLQFTADRWDAWFRLAECFDYELDEAVLWSADKINKERGDLVKFQRHAIHCYTLALSHSRGKEDEEPDETLHDLYHKFGMRLYSSSREPFAMEPFQHQDQERYFIEGMGSGTFKKILHEEMTVYKVWKFAAQMFRMAMAKKPNNWKNPYMLAKCYWKMHQMASEQLDPHEQQNRIGVDVVLEALTSAIEVSHRNRKSRQEPILETDYKIVSVLHKMVMHGDLSATEAASILSDQPFGVETDIPFSEPQEWEDYVVKNVVKLKEKDKSNWQHRIIMRHASIAYDSSGDGAQAAFSVLRETMFTKTMVMNVWKCDAERPGRHHVYTEQYVRFMEKLLILLDDRNNMELLLRRLRKKGADFYHFQDLWQSCCTSYLKLLRKGYQQDHVEDPFKTMVPEIFEIVSDRITEWATPDGPYTAAFSCLKDAIELKKLNSGLMKVAAIDELIYDCYSKVYLQVADSLPGLEPAKVVQARNDPTPQPDATAETEKKSTEEATEKVPTIGGASDKVADDKGTSAGGGDMLPNGDTAVAEKTEPGPRRRVTGVRRPDVLRRAEQAVVHSQEVPKSTSRGRVGSMSSRKRGSQTPAAAVTADADGEGQDTEDEDGPDAQVRREADENMEIDDEEEGSDSESEEHSHDEAGDDADESDLSDVPEDYDDTLPASARFPNLVKAKTAEDTDVDGMDVVNDEHLQEDDMDIRDRDEEPEAGVEEEDMSRTIDGDDDATLEVSGVHSDEGDEVEEEEGDEEEGDEEEEEEEADDDENEVGDVEEAEEAEESDADVEVGNQGSEDMGVIHNGRDEDEVSGHDDDEEDPEGEGDDEEGEEEDDDEDEAEEEEEEDREDEDEEAGHDTSMGDGGEDEAA